MTDVIVVGAGVVGLTTALALRAENATVTLVDEGRADGTASWAGGGILSPLYPWRYSPAVHALALAGARLHPCLRDTLVERTGIDPELRRDGLVVLDAEVQAAGLAYAEAQGIDVSSVGIERLRALLPGLTPDLKHGLYFPEVATVRNPRLLSALRAALEVDPGVRFERARRVEQLVLRGGRVQGVATPSGNLCADRVVLACGAWAGLLDLPGGRLQIVPVRGQMLLFRFSPPALEVPVLFEGRYLVPRSDGHLLVGSTLETAEFDSGTTAEAAAVLEEFARRLFPMVFEGQAPLRHWAGLRPGSADGIPWIGPWPETPGLYLNVGHYRYGLTMAPAAARLLVESLMGRASSFGHVADYAPENRRSATQGRAFSVGTAAPES